jgi:PAS domain S-box-containing protein
VPGDGDEVDCALEDIVVRLEDRPSRLPEHEAEADLLATLAHELTAAPEGVLQRVANAARELCRADSAGISVLDPVPDGSIVRWQAVAGPLASWIERTMRRDDTPCGTVLAAGRVMLFDRAGRYFPALRGTEPPLYEMLQAPWTVSGDAVGTLWTVAHDPHRRFDAEDARLLTRLSRMAAAGWQVTASIRAASDRSDDLERQMRERASDLSALNSRFRADEERLRRALSIDTVGVLFFRLDGRIIDANTAMERMSGYPAAELRRIAHWERLAPVDARARAQQATAELASQGRTAPYEGQFLRRDGSTMWGLFATALLNGSGSDTECVGFVIDISDRKRAESALRAAQLELESRVRERTAALAQANASLTQEVGERRAAESQIKTLFKRLVTAQEEERRRIARDVHDQLGQQMTAVRMHLEMVQQLCGDRPDLALRVERTARVAEELDRSIDFLTWELRPAALDHLGLAAALRHLVDGWGQRFRMRAEYQAIGMERLRLPDHVEANLYRLAQEALHNVFKHAHARQVHVRLEQQHGHLVLTVSDDGCGFDPEEVARERRSLGLVSMRERAMLAGGQLIVQAAPKAGTTVMVRLPLDGADAARRPRDA